MDETNKAAIVAPAAETAIDPIAAKDAEIAKLSEERDNYRNVALKRLGKLPGDAEFIDKDGTGMSVAEQVRIELLNREIAKAQEAKQSDIARITKENAELRLALKNRPSASIGGGSGESPIEVKDAVFSDQQIAVLKATALRLKADPEKYIAEAKKNVLSKGR